MLLFWLQLLESLNFSIFGPHVKLQPTSNESLIKQTKNSMCDRCEFPPGQDVGMETRRLDTTELKVLTKSQCPSLREKRCILCLPERNNSSSEIQRYLDQMTRFWACPSFLRICHSSFNYCSHSPSLEKRNGEFSGAKNISDLRRQKDKAVPASKIILASQSSCCPWSWFPGAAKIPGILQGS